VRELKKSGNGERSSRTSWDGLSVKLLFRQEHGFGKSGTATKKLRVADKRTSSANSDPQPFSNVTLRAGCLCVLG